MLTDHTARLSEYLLMNVSNGLYETFEPLYLFAISFSHALFSRISLLAVAFIFAGLSPAGFLSSGFGLALFTMTYPYYQGRQRFTVF